MFRLDVCHIHSYVRTIIYVDPKFNVLFYSLHSGYVILFRSHDKGVYFNITVKIWNVQAITNLESALPSTIIQPQFSFETTINVSSFKGNKKGACFLNPLKFH